jgi:hypothetical protein
LYQSHFSHFPSLTISFSSHLRLGGIIGLGGSTGFGGITTGGGGVTIGGVTIGAFLFSQNFPFEEGILFESQALHEPLNNKISFSLSQSSALQTSTLSSFLILV